MKFPSLYFSVDSSLQQVIILTSLEIIDLWKTNVTTFLRIIDFLRIIEFKRIIVSTFLRVTAIRKTDFIKVVEYETECIHGR